MITIMSRRGNRSEQPSTISARFRLPSLGGSSAIVGIASTMVIVVSLLSGSAFLTNVGKVIAFEVLGALLATALLMNVETKGLVRRFRENAAAGPNLLVLAIAVGAVISFLCGPMSKWLTANEVTRVLICTVVYFGVLYNLRGRLTVVTDVILAVAAVVSIVGLIGVGNKAFDQVDGVSGTFGTHEALGSFLMLMLPMTAAMGIFNNKDLVRRYAALAVSLLVTVCLAFTQSRSGWISELVALGVLALLATRFHPAAKQQGRSRIMSALPFLVFACIAVLMLVTSESGSDVMHRAASFGAGSTDISVKQRLMLWHAAISMIAAKPLFGWGIGSFPYIASNYTPVAASGAYVAAHGVNLNNIAHNLYLQIAAETGLLGLGLYVGMVVTFFITGVRALFKIKDATRKMVLVGVLAAMAGQVVDAVTSPSYNIASVSLIQWLLMGVGMYAAGVPKQEESSALAVEPKIVSVRSRIQAGMRGAAAATALVVTSTLMLGTANSAVADTYITVDHNEGVSDTDAILIGIGAAALGWYVGSEIQHSHDH